MDMNKSVNDNTLDSYNTHGNAESNKDLEMQNIGDTYVKPDNGSYHPNENSKCLPDIDKAEIESLENNSRRGGINWKIKWLEFCQDTSFHALKQITEPQPFILRRIFWLLLFIVGTVIFLIQMVEMITFYSAFPVVVDIKINYNDSVEFPAVTICNNNAFRSTVAYENGEYGLITDMFKEGSKPNVTFYDTSSDSIDDIYRKSAHTAEDFIVSCEWDNTACSEKDFVTTPTDFGICYTFNSYNSDTRKFHATQTGSRGGLRLQLNIEQYEYMEGPNDGAGVKVSVHKPNEIAMVRDHGLAVPPGQHAFIGIKIQEIHNMEPPHGKCDRDASLTYYDDYTTDMCWVECSFKYILRQCGCRNIDIPRKDDTDTTPFCSLREYSECVVPHMRSFGDVRDQECTCPVSCERRFFESTMSYAATSNFDMDSMLNSYPTDILSHNFIKAREIGHRVNKEQREKDNKQIDDLANSVQNIDRVFTLVMQKLSDVKNVTVHYHSDLKKRMTFHEKNALRDVKYITEHDFQRGWLVYKERGLNFVAYDYNDVVRSYVRLIEGIKDTTKSKGEREAIWYVLDNILGGREDKAIIAQDNITTANNAYETGTPILTYKNSYQRHYDMSFVSMDLLNSSTGRNTYFQKLKAATSQITESLQVMREMATDALETGNFDPDQFKDQKNKFYKGCRAYNYQLFLFEDRVVGYPMDKITKHIDEFAQMHHDVDNAFDTLNRKINDLSRDISKTIRSGWQTIKSLSAYLSGFKDNANIRKTNIATMTTNSSVANIVHDLHVLFTEIRARNLDLLEDLAVFELAAQGVWNAMLDDPHTKKLYDHLNIDYKNYTTATDPAVIDFLSEAFASLKSMLQTGDDFKNLAPRTAVVTYNFDLSDIVMNETARNAVVESLTPLRNKLDLSSVFSDADHFFLDSFEQVKRSFSAFQQGNKIDSSFYMQNFLKLDVYMQELSYEEITVQRAYDIPKLLSDIGGSMGLFIGGSAISIFEFFDVIGHNLARQAVGR